MNDLNTWRTVIASISAVAQTAFVLLYLTWPWWRTFLGRALFYNAATLAITFDLITYARLTNRGRDDLLFAIVYGVLATGIVAQLVAFTIVKHRGGDRL